MRPQDIERIAQGVVASLSQAQGGAVPTGCGNFSYPEYTCPQSYSCDENYQCGGLAQFVCPEQFDCNNGFLCACIFTLTATS